MLEHLSDTDESAIFTRYGIDKATCINNRAAVWLASATPEARRSRSFASYVRGLVGSARG